MLITVSASTYLISLTVAALAGAVAALWLRTKLKKKGYLA